MKNIVLNIPHSSTNGIFDKEIGGWKPNPYFYNDCVRKWTDWFTDFIFYQEDENIKSVIFPYSRFVCDVERLKDDPLEEKGQGIIYTHFNNYYRCELDDEHKAKLYNLWENHQKLLANSLNKDSILIDCHSFPSNMSDCDICIGYNNDWSYDSNVVEIIKDEFTKSGYKVYVNSPYSNSITPKTDFEYKSVMIEVNKRVYMDEDLVKLSNNQRQWMRWFGMLKRIYEGLMNYE